MRYFTRKLYLDFNSPDDQVADAADEAWEEALRKYNNRLEVIRDRLPTNVSKLADLNLHDAEVLSRVEEVQPAGSFLFAEVPLWAAVGIVTVRRDNELMSLLYSLWDHIREQPSPDDWTFSKLNEHWLYDEVDVIDDRRGPFIHRILFSTGIELEIPFATVVIHRFPAHADAKGAEKKQSA